MIGSKAAERYAYAIRGPRSAKKQLLSLDTSDRRLRRLTPVERMKWQSSGYRLGPRETGTGVSEKEADKDDPRIQRV